MFKRIIVPVLNNNNNTINRVNSINQINKIFFTTSNDIINNSNSNSNNDDDSNDVDLKLKLYREKKFKNKNFTNMVSGNEFQKIVNDNISIDPTIQTPSNTSSFNFNRLNQQQDQQQNQQSTQQQRQQLNQRKEDIKKVLPKVDYSFKVEIAPGIFTTPALSKVDRSSVIVTCSRGFEEEAKRVTEDLGLDFLDLVTVLRLPEELFSYQSALFVTEKGVSLHDFEQATSGRNNNIRKLTCETFLDFTSGSVHHRTEFGNNKKSPMVRSIKINSKFPDHVMDVTGGLGKDAWVIASMGCKVTIIERNPILVYMMEKALEKARANTETSEIASRITLIHKDSIEYLVENINCDQSLRPDVIYMDPMYPGKKKEKSLSKKAIRAVRRLVGGDRDSTLLFALARRFTKNRVSWKRPKEVVPLLGSDVQYKSNDTVYYVYLRKDLKNNESDNNVNKDDENN